MMIVDTNRDEISSGLKEEGFETSENGERLRPHPPPNRSQMRNISCGFVSHRSAARSEFNKDDIASLPKNRTTSRRVITSGFIRLFSGECCRSRADGAKAAVFITIRTNCSHREIVLVRREFPGVGEEGPLLWTRTDDHLASLVRPKGC